MKEEKYILFICENKGCNAKGGYKETEETRTDIKQRLKEYRENAPETPYKIICKRIKLNQEMKGGLK
jgi:hypothetical protein